MADEGLEWFEAALGAVSKFNTDENDELHGARCPKCDASDFIKISDLYSESRGRIEEQAGPPDPIRAGGMTDLQIVEKFSPPRRSSALGVAIGVCIPLSAGAFYMYRRFGENIGDISIAVDIVITAMVLMTMLRKYSDRFYHRRRRWNRLYMCRKCGQLVGS